MKTKIALLCIALPVISGFFACSDSTIYDPGYSLDIVYPAIDRYPAWSPDGSRIIFGHLHVTDIGEEGAYQFDHDRTGLWIVNADGTGARLLLKARYPSQGEWSHDGKRIAASVFPDIWAFEISGNLIELGSLKQLTSKGKNFSPSWSPDGIWIAYNTTAAGRLHDINRMRWDGKDKRLIRIGGIYPHWSPVDDRITFEWWQTHGGSEVYITYVEGLDYTQITSMPNCAMFPKFSPDGSRIAFISDWAVWIVDADGSNLTLVTEGVVGEGLAWSPDGTYIVFSKEDTENLYNNGTLWITDVRGSSLRQLTLPTR